jgi:hypothetical protein
MKLDTELLTHVKSASEVVVGNIYPAKGGSNYPGTSYWLVIACSNTGAHCIGYDGEGNPCSTTSYLKGALRERPLIGRVDLNSVTIKLEVMK